MNSERLPAVFFQHLIFIFSVSAKARRHSRLTSPATSHPEVTGVTALHSKSVLEFSCLRRYGSLQANSRASSRPTTTILPKTAALATFRFIGQEGERQAADWHSMRCLRERVHSQRGCRGLGLSRP